MMEDQGLPYPLRLRIREYYREIVIRLQEDLCIQLGKIPLGDDDRLEQLNMFGTEND